MADHGITPVMGDNGSSGAAGVYTVLNPDLDILKADIKVLVQLAKDYTKIIESTYRHIRKVKRANDLGEPLAKELEDLETLMWKANQSLDLLTEVRSFDAFSSTLPEASPPPQNNDVTKEVPSTMEISSSDLAEKPEQMEVSAPKAGAIKRPLESTPDANKKGTKPIEQWQKPGRRHTVKAKKSNSGAAVAAENPQPSTSQINNMDTTTGESSANAPAEVTKTPKVKRPPPVFIIPPEDWAPMLLNIRSKITLRSKATGRYLRLGVDTNDAYRFLCHKLENTGIPYKSYLLEEAKPLKAVIRGLPFNTKINNIKDEIESLGFEDVTVTQMYRGPKSRRVLLPLFHLGVRKTPDSDAIFSLTELMGTEVAVEVHRGKKGATQCHNCQGFFHSAAACRLSPRCVKCAKGHRSSECTKPFQNPCVCANCGSDHPANYRSCPKFPSLKKAKGKNSKAPNKSFTSKKVEPARSFAAAATGKKPAPPSS